jgi:hypothetical protein
MRKKKAKARSEGRSTRKRGTTEETVPAPWNESAAEAMRPYMGQWVALDEGGRVRASGATFDAAWDAASSSGLREPEFFFVPERGYAG